MSGDGCFNCKHDSGYVCNGTGKDSCRTVCGDGIVAGFEQCDDGDKGACLDNCMGFAEGNPYNRSTEMSAVLGLNIATIAINVLSSVTYIPHLSAALFIPLDGFILM